MESKEPPPKSATGMCVCVCVCARARSCAQFGYVFGCVGFYVCMYDVIKNCLFVVSACKPPKCNLLLLLEFKQQKSFVRIDLFRLLNYITVCACTFFCLMNCLLLLGGLVTPLSGIILTGQDRFLRIVSW